MRNTKEICNAIELMLDACAEIKDSGKCGTECPLKHLCLEDASFVEVADLLHSEKLAEFLKVGGF